MGIGLIVACGKEDEPLVLERLAAAGEPAARPIGTVVAGAGNVTYR